MLHPGLLRRRQAGSAARVTFVELFFDLVFVYAITQISHSILHHLTLQGLFENAIILLAVWWVWIYTSWATNWLNPEHAAVRFLLFAMMLAGLFLAIAVPQAFGARSHWFALAYIAMQIGRTAFMCWAFARENPANARNFQRILAWFVVSAIFWLAGIYFEGALRLWLWLAAMLIEYAGPACYFWTPGLGCSHPEEWDVEGTHMAERCGLFVIIALGESLLVTGATFESAATLAPNVLAFLVAFIGAVAMWWLYFAIGAERGSEHIASSANPGGLARIAYTYFHLPIVAGIILSAVADELVLKRPMDFPSLIQGAIILAGPAIYLLGTAMFKTISAGRVPLSHLVGLAVLALLAWAAPYLPILLLHAMAVAAIGVAAIWEWRSLRAH